MEIECGREMHKLVLMSVMLVTVALPIVASRDPIGLRGLKRMLLALLIFNFIYALLIITVIANAVPEPFIEPGP